MECLDSCTFSVYFRIRHLKANLKKWNTNVWKPRFKTTNRNKLNLVCLDEPCAGSLLIFQWPSKQEQTFWFPFGKQNYVFAVWLWFTASFWGSDFQFIYNFSSSLWFITSCSSCPIYEGEFWNCISQTACSSAKFILPHPQWELGLRICFNGSKIQTLSRAFMGLGLTLSG